MMQIKPFGFDRTFQTAAADIVADLGEDLLAEITSLRATIAQMHARHDDALHEARREGFEAGRDQAREERSQAVLAATDALHAALEDLDMRLSDQIRAIHQDAADVALAAAEILAGHAIDVAPARAIDEAIDRALQQVGRGTQLRIHVHPTLAATMEELLAARAGRERRKLELTLVPDPAIVPGDGTIAWNEGALAVDGAARRAAVMAELAPLIGVGGGRAKESGAANIAAR
jgi:flagellar assembly protein FliH